LKFTYDIKPRGYVTVETVDFGTIPAGTSGSKEFKIDIKTNIDYVNVKLEIVNITEVAAVFDEFSVRIAEDTHIKTEISLSSPTGSFMIHKAGSYTFRGAVAFTAKPIATEAKGVALVDLSLE